jgi:hypothetical protein
MKSRYTAGVPAKATDAESRSQIFHKTQGCELVRAISIADYQLSLPSRGLDMFHCMFKVFIIYI